MKAAVIGGDKRMLFTAKELLNDGFEVCIAGFDHLLSLCDILVADIETAAAWADMIILPVRPMKGDLLTAPFSDDPVKISDLMRLIGNKPVFTGSGDLIRQFAHGAVYDYTVRDEFVIRNAGLTAEGALGILLNDYEGSVFGTDFFVMGYGRIGKLLSRDLFALGANVTIAARKASDRSMAEQCGINAVNYPDIDFGAYDVIFNTVPALIADSKAVDSMREDVFLVDLASAPGGVDHIRARERGLTCIHALSLPGKTAPLAAGRIIKDTVLNILSETLGYYPTF